ncbi:MAG: RecX family transcriptional regulator [Oscillospiraceae bacterium]|nr:RecX family transcriptional regulator [Oscillospiraceae bacterium]
MRIRSVRPFRNDVSRVVVYFEDRTYLTVDALEAKRLKLAPGMEIDAESLPALSEESRRHAARVKAVQIAGKRSLSRAELMRKLGEKGFSEEDSESAADWLCEMGVLDDTAYAEMLVRHYRAKGFGDLRVREELRRRGIERDLVATVLEENTQNPQDAIVTFLRQKLRGKELEEETKRKLAAALMRRGYTFADIQSGFSAIERGDMD